MHVNYKQTLSWPPLVASSVLGTSVVIFSEQHHFRLNIAFSVLNKDLIYSSCRDLCSDIFQIHHCRHLSSCTVEDEP